MPNQYVNSFAVLSAALLGGWVLSASSDIRSDEVIIIDGCAPPQVMIGGTCSDLSPGGSGGQHGGDPLAPGGPSGPGGGGGGGSPPGGGENCGSAAGASARDCEEDEQQDPAQEVCDELEDALYRASIEIALSCRAKVANDVEQITHLVCQAFFNTPGGSESYYECRIRGRHRLEADREAQCALDYRASVIKAAETAASCRDELGES